MTDDVMLLKVPKGVLLPGDLVVGGLITENGDQWVAVSREGRLVILGSDIDWMPTTAGVILDPIEQAWIALVSLAWRRV